jgi:porin
MKTKSQESPITVAHVAVLVLIVSVRVASAADPIPGVAPSAQAPQAAPGTPEVPATPPSGLLSLDPFNTLLTSDTLTGDWYGLRKQMANKGLTFDMALVQVYQGDVAGGLDKGWNYGGRVDLNINLDTQKMGLWPGGFFSMEAEENYGEFVGPRQTGAVIPADQNSLFPSPGTNSLELPMLMFAQFVAPQLGFYFGKLATVTNDSGDANAFAHGKGSEGFLNTNFGWNPVIALTVPYSTLGAGMIIIPTSDPKEFIINVGVADTQGSAGTTGFNTVFKGGTSYFAEGRYTTHFFGLTGHQLLGGAYSDQLYLNLNQNLRNLIIPGLPVQQHSGSWAAYYNFDQYLYQPDPKADQGFGIFGRVGTSDGIANPIHWFFSGGVGGKGLIPGRTNDQFGIGYYYIVAANARIPQVLNFQNSQGFEAYYEIALTPWMHLTPDIQVIQPSQQRVSTATVAGVRLEIKF